MDILQGETTYLLLMALMGIICNSSRYLDAFMHFRYDKHVLGRHIFLLKYGKFILQLCTDPCKSQSCCSVPKPF